MAFDFDPETASQVRIGAAAFSGAVIYHAARPAATWVRLVTRTIACVLSGLIFTEPMMLYLGLRDDYTGAVGALIGLCGVTIASRILRAVEKLDFAGIARGFFK